MAADGDAPAAPPSASQSDVRDLLRWRSSVRARALREPPPSVVPWNQTRPPPTASVVARELRVAGDKVQILASNTTPPRTDDASIAKDGHEIVAHVVARACDAAADARARAAGTASIPTDARLLASTRDDGVPARAMAYDPARDAREDLEAAKDVASHGFASWSALASHRAEVRRPANACDLVSSIRGLELALRTLRVNERVVVRVTPEYGVMHPSFARRRRPLPTRDPEDVLYFDVQILATYPAREVSMKATSAAAAASAAAATASPSQGQGPGRRREPEEDGTSTAAIKAGSSATTRPSAKVGRDVGGGAPGRVTKRITREGEGWETPRPPFEVVAEISGRVPGGGEDGEDDVVFLPKTVVSYVSGDGAIAPELAAAIDTMRVGEEATIWCEPREGLVGRGGGGAPPASAATRGATYEAKLVALTHVRDVYGDGVVVKRREKPGRGDFPADCPVHDCVVRVHYAARAFATGGGGGGGSGDPAYDTRTDETLDSKPFQFMLGSGAVPDALETSVRLMVPGETSVVTLSDARHGRHGYGGERAFPGAVADAIKKIEEETATGVTVEWIVTLIDFDAPVNWHKAEFADMLREAEAGKKEGNALLARGDLALARRKYEVAHHQLSGLRGMDSDDEHAAVAALKRAVLLNLALALQRQGEHAEALRRLGALLLADGDDVKALWRRSVSLLATHEHDAARRDLLRVYALDPTLAGECEAQLRRVDAREEAALGKEKKVTSAMLSDPVGEEYMDEDSRLAEAMVRDHRVAEAVVKASPSTVSM